MRPEPNSYVARESAARMLREIADEIESAQDDRLVSVRVQRTWATKEEVDRSIKRKANHAIRRLK